MRRQVIDQNLKITFGDDRSQVSAWDAYVQFARLTLEILMLLGPMREFALQQQIVGIDHWRRARARGKGVIFLSSHVGNWEVMASVGAVQTQNDIMLVTKHLKPEWLHQAVERGRARCGVEATYEPRTLKDVLARLRRGGTVGFVMDQYAGPPVGMRVPFFGVHVGTPTVVALIARRTGAAILPVVNSRDASGRFRVEIASELVLPDEYDDRTSLGNDTALLASRIEQDVRRFPRQWLWTHRRFKGDLGPLKTGEWQEGRPRKS